MIPLWGKRQKKTKQCYHDNICRWNRDSFSSETEIKKGNFKKYLMNLIEINHPINMTSDHSISSNNSFKNHLNIKFRRVINTVAVVRSTVILLQCLLQGRCEWIRVIWTQLQKKTKQEASSSAILTDSSFNGDSNKTLNVSKSCWQ